MHEPNLKMCSANSSGKGKNIKQMLCAGGHCSYDCPSAKLRSKVDKAKVGHTKCMGNIGGRVARLERKLDKNIPISWVFKEKL